MQVTKAGLQRVHYVTMLLSSYSTPARPLHALCRLLSWPGSCWPHKYRPRCGCRRPGFCPLCIKQNAPPAKASGAFWFQAGYIKPGAACRSAAAFFCRRPGCQCGADLSAGPVLPLPEVPLLVRGRSARRRGQAMLPGSGDRLWHPAMRPDDAARQWWPAWASGGGAGCGQGLRLCSWEM